MIQLRELREVARAIAYTAIRAVEPEALVRKCVELEGSRLRIGTACVDLADFQRILIIGAGKASASMAKAVEDILEDRITDGIIVVKDGHTRPLHRIRLMEAGHPLPDERGMHAAGRILSLVSKYADDHTLVITLISGGGSALLPLPVETISLPAKQETTRQLLLCGASINEMNVVRKHLSRIKGGRIAQAASPARLFSLVLSDVIGDPLDIIASGPTVGDPSTFSEAVAILKKYEIWDKVPQSVSDTLQEGESGKIPETPDPGDEIFKRVSNVIIGNNRSALAAASAKASALGFHPLMLTTCVSGEARDVGTVFASILAEIENSQNPLPPPACILAGGETTVTVRHNEGKGGRNTELALSAAIKLESAGPIVLASVGTDGTDGPTDAAGAIVDTTTVRRARELGLDPVKYLTRNDSYSLLKPLDDLFITGPTGTNVMDVIIGLVGESSRAVR